MPIRGRVHNPVGDPKADAVEMQTGYVERQNNANY